MRFVKTSRVEFESLFSSIFVIPDLSSIKAYKTRTVDFFITINYNEFFTKPV